MRDFGQIYCLTNTVNGKAYVGQTTMDLPKRWGCHVANKDRTPLVHAIRRYGREAFTVERITGCDDALSMDAAEVFWIGVFGSVAPGGYNLTHGGQSGTIQSAETCAKKSEFHRRRYADPAQRERQAKLLQSFKDDPEVQAKRSAAIRAWWTPERRAAHCPSSGPSLEHRTAGNAARRIRVVAAKDGVEQRFSSSREAAAALGVHESAISMCLKGKRAQAGGFTFTKEN